MLLVMDVGNSHTVVGLYDGETLRGHWRLVTAGHRTSDELRIILGSLLQQESIAPAEIAASCISSVVPQLNDSLQEACQVMFGTAPLFVGPGIRTGLVIKVENPKEVGADRIVNAVGALEQYDGPLILIDFGTATTFDAITAAKEYIGGVIAPGIRISADALFEKCAKLPRVEVTTPATVIGRDTISNIRSGLTYGYADMVDGITQRMKAEMGGQAFVIATGGLAPAVAEIAQTIDAVDPMLTLNGLRTVFYRNKKESA